MSRLSESFYGMRTWTSPNFRFTKGKDVVLGRISPPSKSTNLMPQPVVFLLNRKQDPGGLICFHIVFSKMFFFNRNNFQVVDIMGI